jgi:hypothetical protein
MLASWVELHFRSAFHCEAQVHTGIGQVGVVAVHVFGQAVLVGFRKFIGVRVRSA